MDELSKMYTDLLGHSRKVLAEVANERETWKARAEVAERRVAEFEARLVELDWRPVTEKPGHDGRYLIAINYYGRPYTLPALYDHTRGRWQSLNEEMTPTHWRPLPPPPAATE